MHLQNPMIFVDVFPKGDASIGLHLRGGSKQQRMFGKAATFGSSKHRHLLNFDISLKGDVEHRT